MGEEEKRKSNAAEQLSGIEQARLSLREAKEEFAQAAEAVDPLAAVRQKPLLCAGGAFLLGFGLTALSRQIALLQFIPLALQISESASRLIANLRGK